MIANWAEDPNQDSLKRHLATVPDYLWVAEDGMKVQVIWSHPHLLEYFFSKITGKCRLSEY